MKKSLISTAALGALVAASNASAFFDSDDDWKCYGPYGKIPDCNPYDEFDPRYYMEEMEQFFDDDDYGYGGFGPFGGPWGGPRPYGYGPMPYGPMPYGAPAPMPMPYGAPAPMPAPAAPAAPATAPSAPAAAPMPMMPPRPYGYGPRPMPMPYGAPMPAPAPAPAPAK